MGRPVFPRILDKITIPDFVHLHKKDAGTSFQSPEFEVSANKSECISLKVK